MIYLTLCDRSDIILESMYYIIVSNSVRMTYMYSVHIYNKIQSIHATIR